MRKKFMIGIDLGTDSCGFCLCDENSHIVKKNGKYLWGARLFEEAKDAKDRRTSRTSRRRIARRNKRIQFLQELMANEIIKVDEKFYKRLQFSQLVKEDKKLKGIDSVSTIFNDPNYTDKDYHKKYPTIYHLKSDLMEKKDEKFDIRLIYLALAHYMKHRGHFLQDNIDIKDGKIDKNELLKDTLSILKEKLELNIDVDETCIKINDELNSKKKLSKEFLGELLISNNEDKQVQINKVYILLLTRDIGISYKDMFKFLLSDDCFDSLKDEEDESTLKLKLTLNSETFEDDLNAFYSIYSKYEENEDLKEILDALYVLNNNCKLIKLLGNSNSISEAFVKEYEEHKKQLKEFKTYIRLNYKDKYKKIFYKQNGIDNYASYIGSDLNGNHKERYNKCKFDNFYKFLIKELDLDKTEDEYLKKVKELIDDNKFLVKQRTSSNSVFPYQLSRFEIKLILENQAKFYPFLNEEDEYGSVKDKIIKTFEYKIPYYYGPINRNEKSKSEFAWASYNPNYNNVKIRPWNINRIIDEEKTTNEFIRRLQNKCSYLHSEFCLPKQSPLIQLFNVLNELNKITVNDLALSTDVKLDLIKNVYLKHQKVGKKDIQTYFKSKSDESEDQIIIGYINNNGKEVQLNSSLSSFYQFKKILNLTEEDENLYITNGYIKRLEDIVQAIAIYEDKKLLEKYLIANKHILNLNDDQIKSIKGLSSTGFSRLSKELLIDLKPNDNPSIIEEMINTNKIFMEIVEKEGSIYKKAIEDYNKEHLDEDTSNKSKDEIVKDYIDNMYVSPGMKRPLIQAYKIIEELKHIVSNKEGKVEEYYIECTRTNQEKKGKDGVKASRKQKLKASFDKCKEDCVELNKQFDEENEDRFSSDKIFLYYSQLGRDVYTGKPIDYDRLEQDYDIDHIYPQSKFKDDSIHNRVLTSKSINNNKKSDTYPIPYEKFGVDIKQVRALQDKLLNANLISKEKYNRLTRRSELTDDEIHNFVNRQIVYTSQSVKALKELIETFEPDSKVIMSKGENISDFRRDFDLVKARDANNLHHGHDAFLNIIVGRLINEYFTNNWYLRKGNTSNVNKIFRNYSSESNDRDDILDKDDNLVWRYKGNETLNYISNQIYNNHNILVTTRTYEGTALFSKVSLKSPKDLNKDTALPIKRNLDLRYGGYSDLSFNYYTLIKTTKKGEDIYMIVTYPGFYKVSDNQSEKVKAYNLEKQSEYIKNNYKLKDFEIVIDGLKINTAFELDKSRFCITGKTGSRYLIKNLKEAYYSKDSIHIIKKVSKAIDAFTKNRINNKEEFFKKYSIYLNETQDTFVISPKRNEKCNEITISKQELYELYDEIIKNLFFDIYQSSAFNNLINARDKLINNKDIMKELDIYDLIKLLNESLKLTQTNRMLSNLNYIDESKKSEFSGGLTIPATLPKGIKIVYQSVTGYYKKVVWENK